jgi:cyclophilin family peptidyl-prolyl cis-trans isomerase
VNNFVVLARYHYYDGVPFHRIVPGFVNQTGDPVGPEPGTGGPGYTIEDEPPADPTTAYGPGTVAMARTQEPNSAGSQFFLVVGDPSDALAGAGTYAVLGRIVEGEDVSETINGFGNESEQPTKVVAVTEVTIAEA